MINHQEGIFLKPMALEDGLVNKNLRYELLFQKFIRVTDVKLIFDVTNVTSLIFRDIRHFNVALMVYVTHTTLIFLALQ